MDRRNLLALAVSPLLPLPRRSGFKVGDWVRIVALPSYTDSWAASNNLDCQRHARVLRRCLGRRFQVFYVGADGRPEFDVGEDIATAVGSTGYSISIDLECVAPAPFLDVTT